MIKNELAAFTEWFQKSILWPIITVFIKQLLGES
jgi:hypothetical protein